jgi:uncharacterized repeat protein (TIGR01451 family)
LTVNVATSAPASVTNQVSVAGGGAATGASASDPTTIIAATTPPWTITKTHLGNFTQGQNGATYTITVKNTGAGPTTAGSIAQVMDTLPTGLTAVSIQGAGWICQTAPFIYIGCNRSDSLAAGASYPPITLTVNVAANAPASVTNQVSVSAGGFSSSATATDPTTIAPAVYPFTGHIVINGPQLITENFVPYAASLLRLVNLAGAYTGSGANLKATAIWRTTPK